MRKFLTTSASATFFGNSLYTARIMKDHLEYIVRNQPGMYGVVLVLPAAKDEVRVICNWGDYFEKRLQQHANPSAVLDRIASKCPKVVHMMTGDDPIAQVSLQFNNGEWLHGIGTEVKLSTPYRNAFDLLGSKEIETAVCKVYNYNFGIYAEMQKHCPIPGWVKGLEEVWQ